MSSSTEKIDLYGLEDSKSYQKSTSGYVDGQPSLSKPRALVAVLAFAVLALSPAVFTENSVAAPTGDAYASSDNCDGTEIWCDDFDDLSNWRTESSPYGYINGEAQYYHHSHATIYKSRLVLRATEGKPPRDQVPDWHLDEWQNLRYTSGMVRANSNVPDLRPGQAVEFRVRLRTPDPDNQVGLFPAVWASSWGAGGWPHGGELDWLEVMTVEDPNRAMFSYHWGGNTRHGHENKGAYLDENFSANWHVIRFEYGHNAQLKWYLDGNLILAADASDKRDTDGRNPFTLPVRNIKINLALGGGPTAYMGHEDTRWISQGATGRFDDNYDDDVTFVVDYMKFVNT